MRTRNGLTNILVTLVLISALPTPSHAERGHAGGVYDPSTGGLIPGSGTAAPRARPPYDFGIGPVRSLSYRTWRGTYPVGIRFTSAFPLSYREGADIGSASASFSYTSGITEVDGVSCFLHYVTSNRLDSAPPQIESSTRLSLSSVNVWEDGNNSHAQFSFHGVSGSYLGLICDSRGQITFEGIRRALGRRVAFE